MGDAGQDESLQAAVSKELTEAMAIDEDVNEAFVEYCKRINENLAQSHQRNRTGYNEEEIETNQDETAINARP